MSRVDRTLQAFSKAVEIMRTLRSDKGCAWDREQTHDSLKPYLIEEAYEVIQAIEEGDAQHLKEELGDVLLQILFHAQIAEEEDAFSLAESIEHLNEKMIRRHPHVFGDSKAGYTYKQWEEIKAKEKGRAKSSRIGEFNPALPALSMARRAQENASTVGFDWPDASEAFCKVEEEADEVKKLLNRSAHRAGEETGEDHADIELEIGDLLFSVVNVARLLHLDPEAALKKSTRKFISRFQKMERLLEAEGLVLEDQTLEFLDRYWEKAKADGV